MSYAFVPGAGGGGGVTGPPSSVDSEIVLFDGTGGSTLKSATGSGVVHATSGVYSVSNVVLTSEVTGILPITNGGTNSSTALNNNRVIVSSAGSLVEASAITASRALVSNASGIPVASSVTSTELGYVSGVTSAIQTQIDARVAKAGDTMTGDLTMDNEKSVKFREATVNGTDAVTLKAPTSLSASYTLTLPPNTGSADQILKTDGAGITSWTTAGGGSGDVVGPASSIDSEIVLFNSTTGKLIKRATGTGVVRATSGVYSASAVNLASSDVTGILPIANGGTNSSTALNNNRVMVAYGAAIIENAAITGDRALISTGAGLPTHSTTTATELGYVSGVTSAIQTQINAKLDTINPMTAADLALGDELAIYDISATAYRKITVEKLGGFIDPSTTQGRLTTETGVAISTTARTSQGTLYFTPYRGNRIALYDGTRWKLYALSEVSLGLTLTSGKNYDVFIYDNAGTLTLELSSAWTNDTTRADALTTQDGIYVKSGAPTRKYLGTIRASGTNVTEDSFNKCFIWNHYNQVPREIYHQETAESWSYNTATWRQANNSTANQIAIVQGIANAMIDIRLTTRVVVSSSGGYGRISIGEDSTDPGNPGTTHSIATLAYAYASSATSAGSVSLCKIPSIGYHYYVWLERGPGSGTVDWYSESTSSPVAFRFGMHGWTMR